MKNIFIIIALVTFFVGCSQKSIEITPKQEKVIKKVEPIIEEKIVEEEIIEEEPKIVEDISDNLYEKVALIYPSKVVGPYAKSTVNTLTTFLLYSNRAFSLETFDTFSENMQNIDYQLNQIKEKGFKKVIALFTNTGFESINTLETDGIKIYFPLINKSEVQTNNYNFSFGGISYYEQMNLLNTLSSGKNSMFYVDSYIGNKLRDSYMSIFGLGSNIKQIKRNNNYYKHIMNDDRLKNSTVMLNTPIIKTSIILSQLTAYEVEPTIILSTQLNYNPLLIKLTQDIDRTNFFIVSSIDETDSYIQEYCTLLESDIVYNWVDYSSLVGINYLLDDNLGLVKTKVIDNQADYKLQLYKSTSYGFEKVEVN